METTYDVRIYKIDVYHSRKKNGANTYWVRWKVGGQRFSEPFKHSALADSYRADLITAARKGEAFRLDDGLPISMARRNSAMGWYEFACKYVDMKWPHAAATTRRTNAEAMTSITMAMVGEERGMPDEKFLRKALCGWAFNTGRRTRAAGDVANALYWVQAHTRNVAALRDPEILRGLLDALAVRLDGKAAAATVVRRKRSVLSAAVGYAVELGLLDENPIPALKWSPPKSSGTVDKRRVPSPVQARALIYAVGTQQRTGGRLKAYFGCQYYAALRPEEAVALTKSDLNLPRKGWGELLLGVAEPHAGGEWTDTGKNRDRRGLKHRARDDTRKVPCPPELTALLNEHLDTYGTAPDGRLFRGERNDEELPRITIYRAWQRARREVFTPEVLATSLAATPYDLRHAAVSTWLNGGVPPTTVAEWAGHSVDVLLKVYAKCLDGSDEVARRRVEQALGHRPRP